MTNSTYATFKDRLSRYFNSTNNNDIMILTEITGGVVYPAMSEEEIKVVYELIKMAILQYQSRLSSVKSIQRR